MFRLSVALGNVTHAPLSEGDGDLLPGDVDIVGETNLGVNAALVVHLVLVEGVEKIVAFAAVTSGFMMHADQPVAFVQFAQPFVNPRVSSTPFFGRSRATMFDIWIEVAATTKTSIVRSYRFISS